MLVVSCCLMRTSKMLQHIFSECYDVSIVYLNIAIGYLDVTLAYLDVTAVNRNVADISTIIWPCFNSISPILQQWSPWTFGRPGASYDTPLWKLTNNFSTSVSCILITLKLPSPILEIIFKQKHIFIFRLKYRTHEYVWVPSGPISTIKTTLTKERFKCTP